MAVTTGRRFAAVVLVIGIGLVGAARMIDPGAPPLYDGVLPLEPYLWLNPPTGQAGGPKGTSSQVAIVNGANDLVAVASGELQPQAQIFATPGALTLPPGAVSITVTIDPVPTVAQPAIGRVDGNVYRILVTDQAGRALTASASANVSVVLRSANPTLANASIGRWANGAWIPLATSPSGVGGSFMAVVTEFGDFAVLAPGPAVTSSTGTPGGSGATGLPGAPRPAPPTDNLPTWLMIALVGLVIPIAVLGLVGPRRRPTRADGRRPPPSGAAKTGGTRRSDAGGRSNDRGRTTRRP